MFTSKKRVFQIINNYRNLTVLTISHFRIKISFHPFLSAMTAVLTLKLNPLGCSCAYWCVFFHAFYNDNRDFSVNFDSDILNVLTMQAHFKKAPFLPPPTVGESCACNKPEIIIVLNQNKRAPNITFLPLEAIYQNKHASNVTFLVLSIAIYQNKRASNVTILVL